MSNLVDLPNQAKPADAPDFVRKLKMRYWEFLNKFKPAGKGIRQYEFHGPHGIYEDVFQKYDYQGDLLRLFCDNKGQVVHKWHHYIPLYDRYFSAFRGKPIRFLEIGVSKGGSLQMWRRYFGPEAVIYGIDIDPECRQFDGVAAQVRIGSQDDPDFLAAVVREMGGVDVILDDGSHHMDHIQASLKTLFPLLSDKGIYLIEDLHTAYWRDYGGGIESKTNFFNLIRELIDGMHRWYHSAEVGHPTISDQCTGIHVHDSIVVLEKGKGYEPVHSRVS